MNKKEVRADILSRIPIGSICAEVGVWKGDFSAQILKVVSPKKLYLIDPWKSHPQYQSSWYRCSQLEMDKTYEKVVERFVNENAVDVCRLSSVKAASQFPDLYFDFIYIDGNHLYEFVKKDIESYFPKLKHGGIMVGDDYGDQGWWKDGVTDAFDEFKSSFLLDKTVLGNHIILRKT